MSKFVQARETLKEDLGHWQYKGNDLDLEKLFGFVYLIIDKKANKFYIGKKQFWRYRKNSYKKTGSSQWRKYTSSSSHLKSRMDNDQDFEFHMLAVFFTRAWCNYTEAWLQANLCVMTERDCNTERKWYNNQIAPIRYVPKYNKEEMKSMDNSLRKAKSLLRPYKNKKVNI